jgi:hypothetical protein
LRDIEREMVEEKENIEELLILEHLEKRKKPEEEKIQNFQFENSGGIIYKLNSFISMVNLTKFVP